MMGDEYASDSVRAKAVALGLPPDWRVTSDMAEYYVLERLAHEGGEHRAMYERLVADLAPRLALYSIAICGGELRHLPTQGEDEYECYREHGGECGCHCYDCHWENYHEHDYDCWPDPDEDENGDCTEDCECMACTDEPECGQEEGSPCGEYEFWERDCTCERYDSEWQDQVSAAVRDLVWETSDGGSRSSAWKKWVWAWHDLDREEKKRFAQEIADAFDDELWPGGGYGGSNWQLIAQLTADYVNGRLKASTYIDRCWSLEHNGGNMFDKMIDHDALKKLMALLVAQAQDEYAKLVSSCRLEVSRLWAKQNMFIRAEFDDAWLGYQNIWREEEVA